MELVERTQTLKPIVDNEGIYVYIPTSRPLVYYGVLVYYVVVFLLDTRRWLIFTIYRNNVHSVVYTDTSVIGLRIEQLYSNGINSITETLLDNRPASQD